MAYLRNSTINGHARYNDNARQFFFLYKEESENMNLV